MLINFKTDCFFSVWKIIKLLNVAKSWRCWVISESSYFSTVSPLLSPANLTKSPSQLHDGSRQGYTQHTNRYHIQTHSHLQSAFCQYFQIIYFLILGIRLNIKYIQERHFPFSVKRTLIYWHNDNRSPAYSFNSSHTICKRSNFYVMLAYDLNIEAYWRERTTFILWGC